MFIVTARNALHLWAVTNGLRWSPTACRHMLWCAKSPIMEIVFLIVFQDSCQTLTCVCMIVALHANLPIQGKREDQGLTLVIQSNFPKLQRGPWGVGEGGQDRSSLCGSPRAEPLIAHLGLNLDNNVSQCAKECWLSPWKHHKEGHSAQVMSIFREESAYDVSPPFPHDSPLQRRTTHLKISCTKYTKP